MPKAIQLARRIRGKCA
nr:unnamed protein product [Callosobruchus chinensis]